MQTNLLRDLAAFRARTGCALSIHVDLDPSVTPTTPDVDARFRAVLTLVNGGEVMRFGAGALGDEEIGAVLRF